MSVNEPPRAYGARRFNDDVAAAGGYAYTKGDRLSCRLANQRITDAILEAVEVGGMRVIDVGCGDGTYSHDLEPQGAPFDVAVLRGVLHHLERPTEAIRAVCRVAREIVTVEPNGYSPVLKVIERVSPYHLAHGERSYSPRVLDRWFQEAGGRVVRSQYIGLVPMFCPDFFARFCKWLEPRFESSRILRSVCCAQYVQTVRVPRST
jgi:hypothetical protein